jgi:hypothetical protein
MVSKKALKWKIQKGGYKEGLKLGFGGLSNGTLLVQFRILIRNRRQWLLP